MVKRKRLFKKFEDLFVAITFAEAGEFDAARQIIKEQEMIEKKRPKVRKIVVERLRSVK